MSDSLKRKREEETFPDWVLEANQGKKLSVKVFKTPIIPYNVKPLPNSNPGKIRVLKIYGRFSNVPSNLKKWPSIDGYERFNVCKNNRYQDLSPMILGPVFDENRELYANNIEDGWQCSKVSPSHIGKYDPNGDEWLPNWKEWSKRGRFSGEARRHRIPKKDRCIAHPSNPNIPTFLYYMGERLSYKDARKRMYMKWYKDLVVHTNAYKDLKARHLAGINLLLLEFDGLDRYNSKENVDLDQDILQKLLEDDSRPFGHGLVLACILLDCCVWEK